MKKGRIYMISENFALLSLEKFELSPTLIEVFLTIFQKSKKKLFRSFFFSNSSVTFFK